MFRYHLQHVRQLLQDSGAEVPDFVHAGAVGDLPVDGVHRHSGPGRDGAGQFFQRKCAEQRRVAGHVQHVCRRRAWKLRHRRAGHHALHQRDDHHPIADGGLAAIEQAGARRRRPRANHPIRPLSDGVALPGAGLVFCHRLGTSPNHFPRISRPAGADQQSHLVSHPNGADHDDRHDAADVAGRTNHRSRHRQRRFAGHHHRHCGAVAAGRAWRCMDMFFPAAVASNRLII